MTSTTLALRLSGAAALTALAACQSGGFALNGSPEGVPVAVESVDGLTAPVKTAFASELEAAATSRRVDLVGAGGEARYRVRGYVSTQTNAEGEPVLAFVWDVFDGEMRRAKRLAGSSPVRTAPADRPLGRSADPSAGLDKETLAKLASTSMDEIAAFIREAKAGAMRVAEADTAPRERALGFAPR
jgi:hypothetical protein